MAKNDNKTAEQDLSKAVDNKNTSLKHKQPDKNTGDCPVFGTFDENDILQYNPT